MHYATPHELGRVLCQYLVKCNKIVEPSVGEGALLSEILKSKFTKRCKIVALDIDIENLKVARERFKKHPRRERIRFQKADFLNWGMAQSRKESVDSIVMNPPFNARFEDYVDIAEYCEALAISDAPVKAPIEIAFILVSLLLLKSNGRLLAVLPSSIICGNNLKWLRVYLISCGVLECIHELPEKSFPGLESRVYLLVFVKGRKSDEVMLMNHDLLNPHHRKIAIKQLSHDKRLDSKYYRSKELKTTLSLDDSMNWVRLGDQTIISRGGVVTPSNRIGIVHTTSYRDNYWGRTDNSDKDIYVARVGRSCSKTFGIGSRMNILDVSDCVYRIRVNDKRYCLSILFAIKVILHFETIAESLESGTGAKYIRIKELRDLRIPLNLFKLYASEYKLFKRYQLLGQQEAADRNLRKVAQKLEREVLNI